MPSGPTLGAAEEELAALGMVGGGAGPDQPCGGGKAAGGKGACKVNQGAGGYTRWLPKGSMEGG
jgi:hypothetical protein